MMFALLQLLIVQTPCFDVQVEVDIQHVVQIQLVHDGVVVETIDHGGTAHQIRTTVCGLGEWVVNSKTATNCTEMRDGQRYHTGEACEWESEWVETMTATVEKQTPNPPTFLVKLNQ